MPNIDDTELPSRYQLIYAAVLQIPAGKVASYGDVAALAGLPNHARMAGYALHNLAADSPVLASHTEFAGYFEYW